MLTSLGDYINVCMGTDLLPALKGEVFKKKIKEKGVGIGFIQREHSNSVLGRLFSLLFSGV